MNKLAFLLCALAAIWVFAGCDHDEHLAFEEADSWYKYPMELTGERREIPPSEIYEVTFSRFSEAEYMLSDECCVELDNDAAYRLTGVQLPDKPGTRPYLVRAVFLNAGAFSAESYGDVLWMRHGCLGHGPVPMNRAAVVIQLERKPENVFTTCSMCE